MGQMPPMLPPLTWGVLGHTWVWQPVWTAVCALLAVLYGGCLVVSRRHGVRAVHPARAASFFTGLLVLVATVSSAVDEYAMSLFWDHMVEHLLLIMVVPALLVVGHPLSALRSAAATRGREGTVDAVLQRGPVAVLTHPLVGLGLYTVVIVGTHLTHFMDSMVLHPWLMGAEKVLYVVVGYVFLLPILGAEPIRWRLPLLGRFMLLLVASAPDTVVGIVLMQALHDPFPVMMATHPAWAPPPLDDVDIAGGLMWALGDGLMMLFGLGVVVALITHQAPASVLGARLEGVRRRTLAEHVQRAGDDPGFAEDADVDEDDAALAAYNRMLGRLSGEQ